MMSLVSMTPLEIESKWLVAEINVTRETTGPGRNTANIESIESTAQIAKATKNARI